MAQLFVNNGLRSQFIQILVSLSHSSIELNRGSSSLEMKNPDTSDLIAIIDSILANGDKGSSLQGSSESEAKECIQMVQTSFVAADSNKISDLMAQLNQILLMQSYLVGFSLTIADIAAFICIYAEYAKLKNDSKYHEIPCVTRWFDLIQNQLKGNLPPSSSSACPAFIPIKTTAPAKKKAKKAGKSQKKESKKQPIAKGSASAAAAAKDSRRDQRKKKKKGQSGMVLNDHLDEIEFIPHRIKLFETIHARQVAESESADKEIVIELPDGQKIDGIAGKTSPMSIATNISKSLARKAVVAKVDGVLFDMTRPFEDSCKLEILTFDSDEGKHVFWHSSSHVLGQAIERLYKGKLTVGPALDPKKMLHNGGFYYDFDTADLGENMAISETHYQSVESLIKKVVKDKQPFQRVVLTKDEALEMFKFNKYKQELISDKVPDGEVCTAYRCGPLIDLCRGPHIPNTSIIKSMKLVRNGATYWKNDNERDSLQRVYGISFPDGKMMKDYEQKRKAAEENDHRKIGKAQSLFFFHDLSPGSCFWLPHGARIYSKLQQFIEKCYRERGFTSVVTPNVFNFKLWEISGHAANYVDDMFLFHCEDQKFGLKPMNCPGHCLMFKNEIRSYRDLPIRFADTGALHRNEDSGALTGLTRVRRFCQDDAHIFCRRDQIKSEIAGCLDFMDYVYSRFGFKFQVELSTRPEKKFLGDISVWNDAEKQLADCLDEFVSEHKDIEKWEENPGDGAFYGPKIDISVFDSLGREHQCATIQLDFQLPIRFGLDYKGENGDQVRPVIVHRAIYGSFERFIGILCEHIQGKWPFWISPRQAVVVPVTPDLNDYAREVEKILYDAGYWCVTDDSKNRLNKKIRNAQISQTNFILVVGAKEREKKTVNVRTRDNQEHGEKSVSEVLDWFKSLEAEFK